MIWVVAIVAIVAIVAAVLWRVSVYQLGEERLEHGRTKEREAKSQAAYDAQVVITEADEDRVREYLAASQEHAREIAALTEASRIGREVLASHRERIRAARESGDYSELLDSLSGRQG